jgi:hypothetical protein
MYFLITGHEVAYLIDVRDRPERPWIDKDKDQRRESDRGSDSAGWSDKNNWIVNNMERQPNWSRNSAAYNCNIVGTVAIFGKGFSCRFGSSPHSDL